MRAVLTALIHLMAFGRGSPAPESRSMAGLGEQALPRMIDGVEASLAAARRGGR